MWIEFRKDIFETKDSKSLNFIIQLLTWNSNNLTSRYNILIDSRKIQHTENYRNLSANDKKLIDDEFDAYVTTGSVSRYYITDKNKEPNSFNLEESIRFFIQPVSIILENSKNDASFINAIVYHFDDNSQIVAEHIKNGWIQFENAGGCGNVINFIEGKRQSFNDLSYRNNKQNHQYLRCIVILDSDREYPTQPQKQEYVILERFLFENGITNYHILEKRMMENYMPDEVFEDLKNKITRPWINVYDSLNSTQKDYLSYKNGFSYEEDKITGKKYIKAEVKKLYAISEENLNVLDGGLNYPNFKENFPKLFVENGRISKYTMKNRSGTDELERILKKIKLSI